MRFRLLLAICCLPCFATAQAWHAVAKAGTIWNSRCTRPSINEHASPLNILVAVGVSRMYGPWEGGLTIGLYRYAFRIDGVFQFGPDPVTGKTTTEYHRFIDPFPAFAFKPYLNRYFDTGKLALYAGIAPAYLLFFNRDPYNNSRFRSTRTGESGYGLELHGGCCYRLSEGVFFFGEPAIGFVNLTTFTGRASMLTASLAIGFRLNVK